MSGSSLRGKKRKSFQREYCGQTNPPYNAVACCLASGTHLEPGNTVVVKGILCLRGTPFFFVHSCPPVSLAAWPAWPGVAEG